MRAIMYGKDNVMREKQRLPARWVFTGYGIIVLFLFVALTAYAVPTGGAYAGLLTRGDWRNLQEFYDLYYIEELGLIKEFKNELVLFKRHNDALDAVLKRDRPVDKRCGIDCARFGRLNNQVAEINKLLSKARGQAVANSRLLLKLVQSSTKANVSFMEAQAAYELRKLGFDIPKIVADTFNFDFGPLMAQLARNLGAEGAAGPVKHVGSVASRTMELNQLGRFYPKKRGLSQKSVKRALGTAVAEELARALIPSDNANEQFYTTLVSRFTVELASGTWEKLNELAVEGKPLTNVMLAQIAAKSLLTAYAGTVEHQLEEDVERARKDTLRSESSRLLAIAEWKAMMHLRRLLSGNKREGGVAQELNWETGHLLHLSGRMCTGVDKEMPRTLPAENIRSQSMLDMKATLRKALALLRKTNHELSQIVSALDRQECDQGKVKVAIAGKVRGKEGGPISGAIVSVQLAGKRYRATSDAQGAYAIGIPSGTELPDSLFVTAEKAGYVTATRSVKKESLEGVDFVLDKESKDTVQIDSGLHHLGNGHYGGAINSQFQVPQAEGASYRKNFHLSEEQTPPHIVSADLLLTVRGAEKNNPVAINGLKIGFLSASNPDGSASVTKLAVDACSLAPGDNTLTITASVSNSNGDIDDFEFTNVQLVLKEADSLELDDPALAKLSKVKAMAADFSRSIRSVNVRSRFSVEATGKGRCARAPDVAMVQVYLRREGEDQARNLKLVETGPDTGVFRSREPLDVADFQARGGDVLVLRAGLRGTTLKIVEAALKEVWRVYSLEVKRYQRLLPDISLIETRLLRGDGRAVLERVRYPVSLAKGPAVDAMLWSVNWQAGHRLERKQAEGEAAIRRLMVEAESLRETGFPLDALPERMAAAYGNSTRPLKKKWGPPGRR